MATTVSITSAYAGNVATEILKEAIYKAPSISEGLVTVLPNVVGEFYIPVLSVSSEFQAGGDCGWNPDGSITLSENPVTAKKLKIQHEVCKSAFMNTFTSVNSGAVKTDGEIATEIEAALLEQLQSSFATTLDYTIWNGSTASNSFEGLLPQFTADSNVIDVAGVTVSSANVFDELEKVYLATPDAINDDELVYVASKDVVKAYKVALNKQQGYSFNDTQLTTPMGIKMVENRNLPAKTIVAMRPNNIKFGTALESELNNFNIYEEPNGTDLIKIWANFTGGVGYGFGGEIVFYQG